MHLKKISLTFSGLSFLQESFPTLVFYPFDVLGYFKVIVCQTWFLALFSAAISGFFAAASLDSFQFFCGFASLNLLLPLLEYDDQLKCHRCLMVWNSLASRTMGRVSLRNEQLSPFRTKAMWSFIRSISICLWSPSIFNRSSISANELYLVFMVIQKSIWKTFGSRIRSTCS